MLCFLPPIPAAPRPEPPPAPSPERAAEVVLLIFILLNVFFVLAAIAQPFMGVSALKQAQACTAPAPSAAPAVAARAC